MLYLGGPGPLNLLIDSSCIKAGCEGEWHVRENGGHKLSIWRKIHVGIGEVIISNVEDAPMLPELLN